MRFSSLSAILSFLSFFALSCENSDREKSKRDRQNEDNFFDNPEEAVPLDHFKNELANGRSDFTRSFANDAIAWQRWDPTILGKAESAQSPIMALVGSNLGGASRNLGKSLSENAKLRELAASRNLCTVIDINTFPEIGILTYYLSSEIKRAATFPYLIWLSHEGSPITWIPVGDLPEKELEILLSNTLAMVEDTWTQFSEYAVENSRSDNLNRQRRIDLSVTPSEGSNDRNLSFRNATRQLSSLYSPEDRDLDHVGGLIPTSSLELLAIGSRSKLLTDEVRQRCAVAAKAVSIALRQEAIKDHLDHSYFFARRTDDWSLPSFSKKISAQARMAHMMFRVGTILNEPTFLEEGRLLIEQIKNVWLSQSISSSSPAKDPDDSGKFLWKIETLKEILSEVELPLAVSAFSLKKEGNIPSEVDPLANFFELNTLRRRVPLQTIATQFNQSISEIQNSLAEISAKLLKHRKENITYVRESTLCLSDLAVILKAQVAQAVISGKVADYQSSLASAQQIIRDYQDPEKGFSRIPKEQSFLQARCIDYATSSHALISLYQATLDEEWLSLALQILDEAILKLKAENGLLAEIPENEQVFKIRQHNQAMIFGESSLGVLDQSFNRAWAITGDEKYRILQERHQKCMSELSARNPVNHTDYIASCALGNSPLLAIVKGDPKSAMGQEILRTLNSQKHLPFLSIRAAKASDAALKQPAQAGTVSVTLIQNGEIVGSATSVPVLRQILNTHISGN